MLNKISASAIVAGALCVSAVLSAHDRITTKVTWDREVSRIVQARCVSCHVDGGRAPMPLGTYEQARPWAKAIRDEVLARRMPKWHAARGYGDFANDPSLSPFEIGLIVAWADGGAPRTAGTAWNPQPLTGSEANAIPVPSVAPHVFKPLVDGTREFNLACGDQPLEGALVAVTPQLAKGASASLAALLPDGRREIVAWIRDYDPDYPTTYWLRTPMAMPPGSRLMITASGGPCGVAAKTR